MGEGSITFSYDAATGLRVAIYRGVVDDACLLGAYRELMERPDFEPLTHDLADLRAIERLELTSRGLAELGRLYSPAASSQQANPLPGLAIVATDPVAYGFSRMYQLMTEGSLPKQTRVFQDHDEALAWLLALPHPG